MLKPMACWLGVTSLLMGCHGESTVGVVSRFVGFGANAQGAAACTSGEPETYVVSSLDDGPMAVSGTLRDAVDGVCRHVTFAVAGTIELIDDLSIHHSFTTIDGSSAPSPGITIQAFDSEVVIATDHAGDVNQVVMKGPAH